MADARSGGDVGGLAAVQAMSFGGGKPGIAPDVASATVGGKGQLYVAHTTVAELAQHRAPR